MRYVEEQFTSTNNKKTKLSTVICHRVIQGSHTPLLNFGFACGSNVVFRRDWIMFVLKSSILIFSIASVFGRYLDKSYISHGSYFKLNKQYPYFVSLSQSLTFEVGMNALHCTVKFDKWADLKFGGTYQFFHLVP